MIFAVRVCDFTSTLICDVVRRTHETELENAFKQFGRITFCDVKSAGYGFIHFEDHRDADEAIRKMDGTELDGKEIVVESAKSGGARGR